MQSSYLDSLDKETRERYWSKLTVNGVVFPDPLDENNLRYVFGELKLPGPAVDFGDIWVYLTQKTCFYTKEAFKAYKSLDGYNYYSSGKVRRICSFKNRELQVALVACEVEASQRLNKWYTVWVMVQTNGTIISGHCTCMAGLGEACSHISALLFALEAQSREGGPSCTSIKCAWSNTKSTAEPQEVHNIVFTKRSRINSQESITKDNSQQISATEEIISHSQNILCLVKDSTTEAVILSMCKEDSSTDTCSEAYESSEEDNVAEQDLPKTIEQELSVIHSIYDISDHEDCKEKIKNIFTTQEQREALESATGGQSYSLLWKEHKVGRITASQFHKILHCKTSEKSIVAENLGYLDRNLEQCASIAWGRDNEIKALAAFFENEKEKHTGAQLSSTGLFIDADQPFLGAAPDAIFTCKCYGNATVEVKCPHTLKGKISRHVVPKNFCLDGNLNLKSSHAYFTQVQGQMGIVGADHGYFIVYTAEDIIVNTVLFDRDYWQRIKKKLTDFFICNIVPELCHRSLKATFENAKLHCQCQETRTGMTVSCFNCKKMFSFGLCESERKTQKYMEVS